MEENELAAMAEMQGDVVALMVAVSALMDGAKVNRDSVMARFRTLSAPMPTAIAERGEATLRALLAWQAGTTASH